MNKIFINQTQAYNTPVNNENKVPNRKQQPEQYPKNKRHKLRQESN
jgi:hypothetical protein